MGQERECRECGAAFRIKHAKQQYCSRECSREGKRGKPRGLKHEIECAGCGKRTLSTRGRYCSLACNARDLRRRKGEAGLKAERERNGRRKEYLAHYQASNRDRVKAVRSSRRVLHRIWRLICAGCGKRFTDSNYRTWCLTCADSRAAEQGQQYYVRYKASADYTEAKAAKRLAYVPKKSKITCGICGGELRRRTTGWLGRKWCSEECAEKAGRCASQAQNHRRAARLAGRSHERFSSLEIYERDGWRCGICRGKVNRGLASPHPMSATLDHIVPISDGGVHMRWNVQLAHRRCNVRKSNRHIIAQFKLPIAISH